MEEWLFHLCHRENCQVGSNLNLSPPFLELSDTPSKKSDSISAFGFRPSSRATNICLLSINTLPQTVGGRVRKNSEITLLLLRGTANLSIAIGPGRVKMKVWYSTSLCCTQKKKFPYPLPARLLKYRSEQVLSFRLGMPIHSA